MPSISLKKTVYDAIVREGEEPAEVANRLAADWLAEERGVEVEVEL